MDPTKPKRPTRVEVRDGFAPLMEGAVGFKLALLKANAFTPDEIAAMLGSYVLACMPQRLEGSPEQAQMFERVTRLSEELIADGDRD